MRCCIVVGLLFFAPSAWSAEPSIRLVDQNRHEYYLGLLRQSKNAVLMKLAASEVVFYTDREMPRTYQDWDRYYYGIGPVSNDPGGSSPGNPNREFPWKETAGIDKSPNAAAVRFLVLPSDGSPIVWWKERMPGVEEYYDSFVWEFPVGTVVGEVLTILGPEDTWYTFEVRTRTKSAPGWKKGWVSNVYRPFRTPPELLDRIKKLRPKWERDETIARFVAHFDREDRGELKYLRDANHRRMAFDELALVDTIPALPNDLVIELLTKTPFHSTIGAEWISNGEYAGFAPNTEAPFHVVPQKNRLAFIKSDSKSCMKCHETTLMQADDFDGPRDWYGRVRGSDGIFSFHIFDPKSLPASGYTTNVRLRPELLNADRLVPRPQAAKTATY
jgi:hypothetical protein